MKYTDTIRREGRTSTTFVLARFKSSPFRHEFLPILLRLTPPSDFLEFESREMSVALVLNSSEHRR